MKRLITEAEVRRRYDLSHTSVWRGEKAGTTPMGFMISRNSKRYDQDDWSRWHLMLKLRAWISSHGEPVPEPVREWINDLTFRMELPAPVSEWLEARRAEVPKEFLELLEEE